MMEQPSIHIDVVSAEAEIFSGVALFVVAPASGGEVGIYPNHAPMMTTMKPGTVRIQRPNQEDILIFVSGGILEVQPKLITVLADTAMRGEDLDEARAIASRDAAMEAMQNKMSAIDFAKAQSELAESIAQIQAIKKLRNKK